MYSSKLALILQQYIVHEQYNSQTYENDLALMQLATPITLSDHAFPVCLPTQRGKDLLGQTVIASGWGQNESKLLKLVFYTLFCKLRDEYKIINGRERK